MQLLSEIRKLKSAVFTFGRMNPPTIGHQKLIEKVLSVAKSRGADPFVYVSFTQDRLKNPLDAKQKVKFLRLGVPAADGVIKADPKVATPYQAIARLIELGYQDITMVVGQDRVKEFEQGISRYINHPDKTKSFELKVFHVVSAGDRDPDAEGVSGISASKMREFVVKNDFKSFYSGCPTGLSVRFAKELYDLLRTRMGLGEHTIMKSFKHHIQENYFVEQVIHVNWDVHHLSGDAIVLVPVSDFKKDPDASTLKVLKTKVPSARSLNRLKKDDKPVIHSTAGRSTEHYLVKVQFHTKKLDEENVLEADVPTTLEKTKEKHTREKDDLAKRQEREAEQARATDFIKKETDRKLELQKRDAEKRAKQVNEYLEDGHSATVLAYKNKTPGQPSVVPQMTKTELLAYGKDFISKNPNLILQWGKDNSLLAADVNTKETLVLGKYYK